MAPLFSIITVTYNASDTIERTLRSVDAQSCRLFEHIIVDGASSDDTLQIVERCMSEHTIVVSERDSGIYDAMNKGISLASGDYLIFLNSGDKFHSPDTLQVMADAILNNDYPGIVYGQTDIVDNDGKYLGPRHLRAPERLTYNSFAEGMVVCHQAMAVYNRIVVPYNLRYKYSADYEWCIICLQHSKRNVYIPQVIIDYLNEGTTTSHHKASLKERFRIMCHYYGTFPTLLRHVGFLFRYLSRRNNASNIQ